jgi:hypothetical protein
VYAETTTLIPNSKLRGSAKKPIDAGKVITLPVKKEGAGIASKREAKPITILSYI